MATTGKRFIQLLPILNKCILLPRAKWLIDLIRSGELTLIAANPYWVKKYFLCIYF